jgi:predicted phosphate transport protein (TIGR00153 family)
MGTIPFFWFKMKNFLSYNGEMAFLSNLFGRSPVSPLQQHMAKVQACLEVLHPFFVAVFSGDWDSATRHRTEITERENEADKLKKQLRLQLPKGLLMPVARRDVLEVLRVQDKLANKAKDISGLILGRKMTFPEALQEPLVEYLQRNLEAARQAQVAINELDELIETGFGSLEIERVEGMLRTLNKIEDDTDDLQITIRAALLEREKELPPVDVMFMYKIIEWIGDLADLAQRVGSRLEIMLAK